MKDTELYAALLGLRPPWGIREVRLDLADDRVDVWIEEAAGAKWGCPECGRTVPLYEIIFTGVTRQVGGEKQTKQVCGTAQ